MPKKLVYIVCIMAVYVNMWAHENYPVGAKSASMGNVSVMMKDVWSAHNNQGAMAMYERFALGVHYENRFYLDELSYNALVLTVPMKFGVMGFNLALFGDKYFNDKKFGLSYSKKLFEVLSLGAQIDLINTFISEYGKENNICAEICILAEPIKNFTIGAHVFNPFKNNYNISYNENYISTVYKVGMGYDLEDTFMLTVEAEKDIFESPVYRGGIDYYVLTGLYVRAGIASNPAQYTFGLGYVYKRIFADIGFMSHRELGFTSHFSLCYEFK